MPNIEDQLNIFNQGPCEKRKRKAYVSVYVYGQDIETDVALEFNW